MEEDNNVVSSQQAMEEHSLQLLPGEEVTFQCAEEGCKLSNYRFFYTSSPDTLCHIPLNNIDSLEIQANILNITCKEGPLYRCTFSSSTVCANILKEVSNATASLTPFAFKFFEACHSDPVQYKEYLSHLKPVEETWKISDEFVRMGFDPTVWEISNCNENYELCSSYPTQLIGCITPSSCSLASVASFRHSQRIPTIVWRHQGNGMVLARCSQPAVSMFCYRNQHDEELVQSILQACAANPGMDPPRNPESTRLLIIDARAYSVAYCNRVRGGGSEYEDYYPNCEVRFMNLPNIHNVRKSFQGLRQTLFCYSDQSRWLSQLENTNWLMYMSNLLKTVVQVVEAVEDDCRPVLVHCSDGWDRTPQIIALAELCLDPYYRTTAGFQILVEREWVSFGHKFADRCGHPGCCNDVNERCQVFLQFLDCVYQLQAQFPCHFEFNARYLMDLAHHTYSGLYGNFLCNSAQERDQTAKGQTFSVWSHLNSAPDLLYRNFLYFGAVNERVLRPSFQLTELRIWRECYMPPPRGTPPSGTEAPPLPSRPLDTMALGQALSRHSSNLSLAASRTSPPRTPSSGFPATPSDDPGGGALPPPWPALTLPFPSLVQARLHHIFQELENEKARYLRDIQNGKQCSSCRIKENGSPYMVEDHQAHQSSPVAAPEEEFEFLSLEDCPNFCLNHQFQCRCGGARKCGLSIPPPLPPLRCKHQSRPEELVTNKNPVVSTGST